MSFDPFRILSSRTIVLPQEDIDTDQIIPARFLTTTTKQGLGKSLFYDWRYDENGAPLNSSPLNGANMATHKILVGGANFACGSSREHAPWALSDFGFRAVVSSDIADIFKSNAQKNGLLPVEVDEAFHRRLLENPGAEITIDLENNEIRHGDASASFTVEPFARQCLLDGVDHLGFLVSQMAEIERFEEQTA